MMLARFILLMLLIPLNSTFAVAKEFDPLTAKRVLFLGDSITHAGHYIALIEAHCRIAGAERCPEFINLGLPSETCTGLSEPEHPFPRPNVHERIDRALEKIKPDVVVACYGMNDGIYYPFDESRFQQYQQGIGKIIDKVQASGATLILMSPPAFDPLPLKKQGKLKPAGEQQYAWHSIFAGYDDVMKRYAQWITQQQGRVEMVIDLHTPVTQYVELKRRANPDFTMSPDGVHVNNEGHEVLARTILAAWGQKPDTKIPSNLLNLVTKRQQLLHDAWLSEVGHLRPGVKPGLPIDQAQTEAAKIDQQIAAVLASK